MLCELTDTNWREQVLESTAPALVLFWARWSGAARQQSPIFATVARAYEGRLRAGTMNLDVHGKVPTALGVSVLPSFAFVNRGQVVILVPGVKSAPELEQLIAAHLGLTPETK